MAWGIRADAHGGWSPREMDPARLNPPQGAPGTPLTPPQPCETPLALLWPTQMGSALPWGSPLSSGMVRPYLPPSPQGMVPPRPPGPSPLLPPPPSDGTTTSPPSAAAVVQPKRPGAQPNLLGAAAACDWSVGGRGRNRELRLGGTGREEGLRARGGQGWLRGAAAGRAL